MTNIAGAAAANADFMPDLWIGNDFIGGTSRKVTLGDYVYHAGKTEKGQILAERWPSDCGPYNAEILPPTEIPDQIRKIFETSTVHFR